MSSPALPIVDAGAPFEHGEQPAQGEQATPKSDLEKRFESLEADLKSERALRKEAEETAKYWAGQGRQAPIVEEVSESDEDPIPDDPILEDDEKVLLDDIAKEGYAALKKRGFVREADVRKLVREAEHRAMQGIEARDRESGFERQLASEFPELVEDSKRLSRGEAPKTEIWKRAAEIYREAVALDPGLKSTKSALLIAARQAKAEIGGKAKPAKGETVRDDDDEDITPSRGAQRRARIQSQAPEPRHTGGDDDDGAPVISAQAREVLKHLKVSEQDFVKNSGETRNARR